MPKTPKTATPPKPQMPQPSPGSARPQPPAGATGGCAPRGMRARVMELYRCYFISRDGKGLSLASVMAHDATSAVAAAIARFPRLKFKAVEVWLNSDRVLTAEHRGLLPHLT